MNLLEDTNMVEDEQFQNELSEFVASLPKLTKAEMKVYDQQYEFMEKIHDEIRLKNRLFMPVYELMDESELTINNNYGKYMEMTYSFSNERRRVDQIN